MGPLLVSENPYNRLESSLIMAAENGTNGVNENGVEKRKAENGDVEALPSKREKLEGGTLLFSGATDWKDVGRKAQNLPKSANTQWKPVILEALKDVKVVDVNKGCSAYAMAITEEGNVYAWGRNETSQLGLGDAKDRYVPTLINEITGYDIVEVATGKSHTLFLTSEGKVLACGSNNEGQCGTGKKSGHITVPKLISYDGPDIVSVAAGALFSVMVDKTGKVWTFGHPENGTLGHNDDGRYLEKANKVEFRCEFSPKQIQTFFDKDPKEKEVTALDYPNIVSVSCGTSHTVAVDSNNKAYTWGFGGYGRLGHSGTENELVPRLMKALDGKNRGVRSVVCGAAFTLGLSEIKGMVNMWGIYCTNKEANMYPKAVQDLSGWNVRSLACSTKGWTAAADDAVIAMQPSPCYGELGCGDKKKSSAQPTMVDTLDGMYVLKVGAGISHTLYVVRPDKALEKMDTLDQSDL